MKTIILTILLLTTCFATEAKAYRPKRRTVTVHAVCTCPPCRETIAHEVGRLRGVMHLTWNKRSVTVVYRNASRRALVRAVKSAQRH